MTSDDIKAALTLAGEAKVRADDLAAERPMADPPAVDDILRVVRSLQDIEPLALAVRRLADEVLTLRAVLADATKESSMYERGVRDALAAVGTIEQTVNRRARIAPVYPQEAIHLAHSVLRNAADAVRALLPP